MNSETGFYRSGGAIIQDVMSAFEDKYHNSRSFRGVSTGFHHLDLLTNGLRGGELTFVISDEDQLATLFLLSLAHSVLFEQKKAVRFISFRHTEHHVGAMLLSICSQIPISSFISGEIEPEGLATLVRSADKIYQSSLELASIAPDDSGMEPNILCSGQLRPDIVLLDGVRSAKSALDDDVGHVRAWARSNSCPVVLATNQNVLNRYNRDLINLFDGVLHLSLASDTQTMTLSVDRNRNGPTGSISLERDSGGIGLRSMKSTGTWDSFCEW